MMTGLTVAAFAMGPIAFLAPIWLWLIPIFLGLTIWIARKSLSGLGKSTRIAAVLVRTLVSVLLCGAMGEPQRRKGSKEVAITGQH